MKKYRNKKVTIDGIVFDSTREARRYQELKLLQKAGKIESLELQKVFELIPSQWETIDTGECYKRGPKKGQPKIKEKCIERAVTYKADFAYIKGGRLIVEDAKGYKGGGAYTVFKIKRKLLLWRYGIKIREV